MEKQRKEDEEREREEMNNNNSANNNSRYNSRSSSVTTSSGSSNKGRLNSTSRQLEENTVDPDSPRELKVEKISIFFLLFSSLNSFFNKK